MYSIFCKSLYVQGSFVKQASGTEKTTLFLNKTE